MKCFNSPVVTCGFLVLAAACTSEAPKPTVQAVPPTAAGSASASPSAAGREVAGESAECGAPDKQMLAAKVRRLDEGAAEMIEAPESELTQVPTPFLGSGCVVRVLRLMPSHPMLLYVGYAGEWAASLTGSPDAFRELASKAGLQLDGPDQRTAYVRTYFEATRATSERFQILGAITELEARPNLSGEDAARFDYIVKQRAATVKPFALSAETPYKGALYAVKGQHLVRIDVELTAKGEIRTREQVLDENLPIPYAR